MYRNLHWINLSIFASLIEFNRLIASPTFSTTITSIFLNTFINTKKMTLTIAPFDAEWNSTPNPSNVANPDRKNSNLVLTLPTWLNDRSIGNNDKNCLYCDNMHTWNEYICFLWMFIRFLQIFMYESHSSDGGKNLILNRRDDEFKSSLKRRLRFENVLII
jgi:hypothetical protein